MAQNTTSCHKPINNALEDIMRKKQYGRATRFSHRTPDGTYITVYLSSANVADCWTAVLNSEAWEESVNPGMKAMIGMSDNPTNPQGFSQFGEGREGPHLGKKMPWLKVPENIRNHILSRIND